MGQGHVLITFEVASGPEAADEVRGWTVAPNATISLNYTEVAPQTTADENGTPQEPPPPMDPMNPPGVDNTLPEPEPTPTPEPEPDPGGDPDKDKPPKN